MDYELLENVSMSDYTTFKTGGNARELYKIYSAQGLTEVISKCLTNNRKPIVIGKGSNLLVSDRGIDDPVLLISTGYDRITVMEEIIRAEAGASISTVSKIAQKNALSGLEFAAGIPGTVGGAIYMNAGAYGGEMRDVISSVEVLKDGEIICIAGEDMDFGYRHSRAMDEDMIIISMEARLTTGDADKIQSEMNDYNARRREKQPLEYPSAGSTFKRPEGHFAGKLIMDSGLAGKSVGGAMVSPKHCGFIINYNNATSSDIYSLICEVQSVVRDKYGITLEPEVKLIGDFD